MVIWTIGGGMMNNDARVLYDLMLIDAIRGR